MSDADASAPEPDAEAVVPPEPEPAPVADEPAPADVAPAEGTERDEPDVEDGPPPDEHDDEDDELLAVPPPTDPEVAARIEAGLADLAGKVDAIVPDLAALAREDTVAGGLAGIQKGVDELARLTRRADEHVAELHAENQRLRAGELAGATQPMLRDLVRLHDEVTQLLGAAAPEATSDLELVRSRLLDTLARWGLGLFSPATGDALDPRRHQGVGRVPSSDHEPGAIATVRKPGFAHDDGRVFRAAEVEVFIAPPPPPAAPPGDDTTDEETS